MAAIHYDPYADADETDIAMCGTKVGENYDWSSNWTYVSCKKCLKHKEEYEKILIDEFKYCSEQDGAFVDFTINTK